MYLHRPNIGHSLLYFIEKKQLFYQSINLKVYFCKIFTDK